MVRPRIRARTADPIHQMEQNNLGLRPEVCGALAVALFLSLTAFAAVQDLVFKLDPEHSTVTFTLGDVLHTVHGTFQLKQGSLRLDPRSGKLSGEIVADAKSGNSGSGMRDRKMNREVLESDRYPEILFRPDHVEGSVLVTGKSSVRVHGIFTIHGSDHELTVPADVETFPDHWTATLHFAVPYAKWGMKNPSTMFLRVSESVNIDLTTTGILAHP
jgi:polyisoprenoid-binding protein YceI